MRYMYNTLFNTTHNMHNVWDHQNNHEYGLILQLHSLNIKVQCYTKSAL